jgi:23S rRNA (uracil-5-)-methyltransferase RumA
MEKEEYDKDYFEAKISKVDFDGYGISRLKKPTDNSLSNKSIQKYKLLIPYALEDEIVLTSIKLKKRNVIICKPPKEISNENPNRAKPNCPYFSRCGGCFLQHMTPEKQIEVKKEFLKTLFSNINSNKICDDAPKAKASKQLLNQAQKETLQIKNPFEMRIYKPKKQYGYRNRVDLTIANEEINDCKNTTITTKKVSFRQKGTYWKTVNIDNCTIALDSINLAIKKLNSFLKYSKSSFYDIRKKEGTMRFFVIRAAENTNDFSIGLLLSKNSETQSAMEEFRDFCKKEAIKNAYVMLTNSLSDVSVSDEYIQISGENCFSESVLENNFKIPNTSFFQVNTSGFEELLIKTKEELTACCDNLNQMQAIDLFCGVGTITLSLAKLFQKITGYELEKNSVALATENADSNNIKTADFKAIDLLKKENLSIIDLSKKALILDPPRAGIGNKLIEKINLEGPALIVYISCNPKSQSEDIKRLKGYKIKSQLAFDIFPQTPHLENVLILEKV